MSRPAKAEIDLSALIHNANLVRELAPESKVCAVVKANAYGHGAIEVARVLAEHADMLTVSCLEEGVALRQAGIRSQILLLEGVFSEKELTQAAEYDFQLVVHCLAQVNYLTNFDLQHRFVVWLKVDSGMHRLGFAPEMAADIFNQLGAILPVSEVRLMSHFACADEPEHRLNQQQLACFSSVHKQIKAVERGNTQVSLANSAGLIGHPNSHYDWVRPGIMLYGISPFIQGHQVDASLKAVMSLTSEVIALREVAEGETVGYGATWQAERPAKIATVAIGYGDGYPRTAKSGTPVFIRGQRAFLAGRVSMDMITIDVTHISSVAIGDRVELWGMNIGVNEVAEHAGTIGYELVTRMPNRVEKTYTDWYYR